MTCPVTNLESLFLGASVLTLFNLQGTLPAAPCLAPAEFKYNTLAPLCQYLFLEEPKFFFSSPQKVQVFELVIASGLTDAPLIYHPIFALSIPFSLSVKNFLTPHGGDHYSTCFYSSSAI